MKKATRKSTTGAGIAPNSVGTFSTRFSLPSFVKRVEKLTADQKKAITKVGAGNLLKMPNLTLNKCLLVELMERWSCERLAFVLPSRDITINLMDVSLILGLRVIGKPVVLMEDETLSMLELEYGAASSKRKITIASIERRLDALGETVNDDFVRSFLLYTFGTFLFPNTSGNVDSRYLYFLKDLDNISDHAWGAAVFEDISMWLCKRKENNVQYVGGCLLFLQIWSYEHIDIARPGLLDSGLTFPRACRWGSKVSWQRKLFTSKFTELQENQIIWNLTLTSEESDQDIIKELLEAQSERMDLCTPEYSSIHDSALNASVLRIRSLVVLSDSDSDSTIVIEGEWVGDLQQLRESQDVPEVPIDNLGNSFTPCHMSAEHEHEHQHSSTPQDFSTNLTISNDGDLRTRNRTLEDQMIELNKEVDELRIENQLLRNQLSSSQLLEEQNVELKKEVDDLRRENRHLSLSADNHVFKLEKILFANEET